MRSISAIAVLLAAIAPVAISAAGYDYKKLAEDWKTMDCTWCGSKEQTPIDLMNPGEIGQYVQMPMQFAPTFQLPTITSVSANNNGHNVNLEFAAAPGATFRYPRGKTFTSLNGPYTGARAGGDSCPAGSTFDKAAFDNSGENQVEEVQATLLDLHWHVPAEHSVNGRLYAAEAHFVHFVNRTDDPDCTYQGSLCLAVIGVFYDLHYDATSEVIDPGFSSVMNQLLELPDVVGQETTRKGTFNFNAFLPESKEFFHYRGSLTTPGCNENVTWFVLQQPKIMSFSQWSKLHDAIVYDNLGSTNARPPLPLNSRTVKVSNYEEAVTGKKPCHSHDDDSKPWNPVTEVEQASAAGVSRWGVISAVFAAAAVTVLQGY